MRFFWLLAAAVLITAPAQADPARDALAKVAKCADIAAAVERLQCYDAAAGEAKTAMSAPVGAVPQQQASAEEDEGGVLEWFGLADKKPVTKPEEFGRPPAVVAASGPKEITEISSAVVELAKNAYGRSIFILDNGQVWKQIDGDTTEVRDPSKGETMKVTIEKAVFGSFSLSIEGRRGVVKVRRVK
jgi:uncharacterized protein YdeI (BOF family)